MTYFVVPPAAVLEIPVHLAGTVTDAEMGAARAVALWSSAKAHVAAWVPTDDQDSQWPRILELALRRDARSVLAFLLERPGVAPQLPREPVRALLTHADVELRLTALRLLSCVTSHE